MSLASQVNALATRVGEEFNTVRSEISTGGGGSYTDPEAAPSYAGTRTNPFDPETGWYNFTNSSTHSIKAAMSKAEANRVTITAIGHSMFAGSYATQVGKTDAIAALRRFLQGRNVRVGGTGFVKLANNTTLDYRWTRTGTWTRADGGAGGNDPNTPFTVGSTGATATFTSDIAGTVVDLHTFDNTGSFTVSIDGVTKETYAPAGSGSNVIRSYTVPYGIHEVKITCNANSVYLVGVNVRNTTGIEINNAAMAGSVIASWPVGGIFYSNLVVAMSEGTPSIAIIELDTNDILWNGDSAATFKSNYGALISYLQGAGSSVIMVASPPATGGTGANGYPAVTTAAWNAYVSAEYDLADQYNVPLLDLTYLYSTYAAADGIMGDPIHPNDYGYSINATALADFLELSTPVESRNVDLASKIPFEIVLVPGAAAVITPAAASSAANSELFPTSKATRNKVDLSKATQARLVAMVIATGNASGASYKLSYTTTNASTWSGADAGPVCVVGTAGGSAGTIHDSGWVNLPTAARVDDCYIAALVGTAIGNTAATIGSLSVFFR